MDNAGLLKKEQLKARNEKIMQGWLHNGYPILQLTMEVNC